MANSIYPPVLPSKQYSFLYDSTASGFMVIQFEMPSMTNLATETSHVQVSIKYADTGNCAIGEGYSPNRATLFISAKQATTNIYFHKVTTLTGNIWEIKIPFYVFDGGNVVPSTNYSVQIRFGSSELWSGAGTGLVFEGGYSNFAKWQKECTTAIPSKFGEWSNTTQIFCYEDPVVQTSYNYNNFVPELSFLYAPVSDDPVAQAVVEYSFWDAEAMQSVSKSFSGTTDSDNQFTFTCSMLVAPLYSAINGTVHILTQNNTKIEKTFQIPPITIVDAGSGDPSQGKFTLWVTGHVTDVEFSDTEQGDGTLGKILQSDTALSESAGKYTVNIYRCDLLKLNTIRVANRLALVKDQKLKFKDYTVQMGERYEYIFCVMDQDDKLYQFFINPVSPYGEANDGYARLMSMEAAYLVDPNHQLKLFGNFKISNFKRNTSDQFQTTIGAKYPFYSRNSRMNYRTLSVSAAISINFDPTSSFMRLDPENGLFWDTGVDTDAYLSLDSLDSITVILKELETNTENYNNWVLKLSYPQYGSDPDFTNDVNAHIAYYASLIEADNAKVQQYRDTRGTSTLMLWDTDLYEKIEFSLSRRRALGRNGGPDTLEQELVDGTTGLSDKSQISGPPSWYSRSLFKDEGIVYDTSGSDRMVYLEQVFRERVMHWLSNGKPKIWRSETEGNMVVMVTNVSFSPLDATLRQVYTVSFSVTEIADYNLTELIDYNLMPCVIENDYSEVNPYDFIPGSVDPNVLCEGLGFRNIESYYIGVQQIGTTFTEDISQAVVNAVGPLTFSLISGPSGLSINTSGIITWKPTTVLSATLAQIRVTDGDSVATATITIGRTYNPLSFSPYTSVIPAAFVGDTCYVTSSATGGLGTLTFASNNLPASLSIDSSTGVISGYFTEQFDSTHVADITVTDEAGNTATQTLTFAACTNQLTFWGDYLYSIPVSEVGVPIEELDLTDAVSGGTPPYTYSLVGAPGGLTIGISSTTGELAIMGTPTTACDSAQIFQAMVTDADGMSASIHITMNRIVAKFVIKPYYYDPSGGATYPSGTTTYDFKIGDDQKLAVLHVGDKITGDIWADISDSVEGGVPWDDGTTTWYKFVVQSGLRPNFELDSKTGLITGKPTCSHDEVVATIQIYDRRGKKAVDGSGNDTLNIRISKVVQVLSIPAGQGEFLLPETIQDNTAVHDSSEDPYLADGYGFTFDCANLKGGYFISGITGLTVADNLVYDAADFPGVTEGVMQFSFNGGSLVFGPAGGSYSGLPTFSPRVSEVYIKDSLGQMVAIKVDIRQIYPHLAWRQTQTRIPNKDATYIAAGDQIDYAFTGISGGKPNYKFTEILEGASTVSQIPEGIAFKTTDTANTSECGFLGQMKEADSSKETQPTVRLTDDLGQYINKKFTFCKVYYPLTLKVNPELSPDGTAYRHSIKNCYFFQNYTEIKAYDTNDPYQTKAATPDTNMICLRPFIASGGSGVYTWKVNSTGYGDPLGGMTIRDEGYLNPASGSQKPTSKHPYSYNLRNLVVLTDAVLGNSVTLTEDYYTAPIFAKPVVNQGATEGSPIEIEGSTTVTIDRVTDIFQVDPNIVIDWGDGDIWTDPLNPTRQLPYGIEFNADNEGKFDISGKSFETCNGAMAIVWIKIIANNWTQSPTGTPPPFDPLVSNDYYYVAHIKFTIEGNLFLRISENIASGMIGDDIPELVVGVGLLGSTNIISGGVGPYTVKWERVDKTKPFDDGIIPAEGVETSVAYGTAFKISGTRAGTGGQPVEPFNMEITVTDSEGTIVKQVITYGGSFNKLIFTDSSTFDIPSLFASQDYTEKTAAINFVGSPGVSGGTPPYRFYYNDLGYFGTYTIDPSGALTGIAAPQSVEAGTATITVLDSKNMSASIEISVGEVIGKLSWSASQLAARCPGETIEWPSGGKGEFFNGVHFAAGCVGGSGVKTWTLSCSDSDWSAILTPLFDTSTGVLSSGTRPLVEKGAVTFDVTVSDDSTAGSPVTITCHIDEVL